MPRTKNLSQQIDIDIGRTIKMVRTAQGISQTELGAALGVTFQQIGKFELGTNRISASALVLICKRLGVTPMDIIGPHVGEPSELSGLIKQIDLLKNQLADIKAAVKATTR